MRIYDKDGNNEAKILFAGPGGCGKTSILSVYKREPFPHEYIPTIIDNFCKEEMVKYENGEEKGIYLLIWDSSGQNPLEGQSGISFSNLDVVVLCYSVQHEMSFSDCQTKTYKEIINYSPDAAKMVVSMKVDLRDDPNLEPDEIVTAEEGQEWADRIGAFCFLETSSKLEINTDECFQIIAKWCLDNLFRDRTPEENAKKCFCC